MRRPGHAPGAGRSTPGAGPYASCPDIALVPSGAKVWYHCYVVNAYGHRWWYLRISGTSTAGWMSAANLRGQTGPSTRC